jgi:hypothetical protein
MAPGSIAALLYDCGKTPGAGLFSCRIVPLEEIIRESTVRNVR